MHLQDLVIFLVAAGIVVPVAKRWHLSPILGFLLIGLLVGPWGFTRYADQLPWLTWLSINNVEGVAALAELGVVFLLFMIGLELSFDRLLAMRRLVFGLDASQILLSVEAASAGASASPGPAFVIALLKAAATKPMRQAFCTAGPAR